MVNSMDLPLIGTQVVSRLRLLAVSGALVGLAIYVAMFRPRYTRVTAPSGNSYDLIVMHEDSGVLGMFGSQALTRGPAWVVNYYAREANQGEAQDLRELAESTARARHIRFIVVQQTTPVFGRWLPIVTGQMWAYRLSPGGRWELVSGVR